MGSPLNSPMYGGIVQVDVVSGGMLSEKQWRVLDDISLCAYVVSHGI